MLDIQYVNFRSKTYICKKLLFIQNRQRQSRYCCLFVKSSPPTLHPLWGWLSSSVICKCQAPTFPAVFAGRITIMQLNPGLRQQRECVSTYIVLLEKIYNLLKKRVVHKWNPLPLFLYVNVLIHWKCCLDLLQPFCNVSGISKRRKPKAIISLFA